MCVCVCGGGGGLQFTSQNFLKYFSLGLTPKYSVKIKITRTVTTPKLSA